MHFKDNQSKYSDIKTLYVGLHKMVVHDRIRNHECEECKHSNSMQNFIYMLR